MFFKKRLIFSFIILSFLVISACAEDSVEEQIYEHIEEAVILEHDFEQQQTEIATLEKKEQDIFEQIRNLGIDELDEIQSLATQALEVISERIDKVEIEKDSIEIAKEEFVKIETLLEQLKNEEEKELGEEMYGIMMDRYNTYELLNESYNESLTLEKELYTLLKEEDAEQKEVEEIITKINESYEVVLDFNEQFNENTEKYNTIKKKFYDKVDIKVEYEGD